MATPVFFAVWGVYRDRGQGKREEINMGFTSKKDTECGQCQGAILPIKSHGFFNTMLIIVPIGSMYGIYTNIGGILMVNVTIYSIHGSYGVYYSLL